MRRQGDLLANGEVDLRLGRLATRLLLKGLLTLLAFASSLAAQESRSPAERVRALLAPLPADVVLRADLRARPDVVLHFCLERREFERRLPQLGRKVFPGGAIWIAWPKKASKVPTDMTEDVVREVALPTGLVDNKVCAIDATWSGLRLVWRKELRNGVCPI